MNNQLTELLKEARLNSGLRQQDVAEMLGIKNNTLSNWERGRNEPDIDTFIRMCEIYQVDFASLIRQAYGIKEEGITPRENKIIKKYRNNPDMQTAVDRLLHIEASEEETVPIFRAARGKDNAEPQTMDISRERMDKIKKGGKVTDI